MVVVIQRSCLFLSPRQSMECDRVEAKCDPLRVGSNMRSKLRDLVGYLHEIDTNIFKDTTTDTAITLSKGYQDILRCYIIGVTIECVLLGHCENGYRTIC